jgi:hypothetical protein
MYGWATGVNPLPFEPTLEERKIITVCLLGKKGGGRNVSVYTCAQCPRYRRFGKDKVLLFRVHGECSIEKRKEVNTRYRRKRIRRGRIC